MLTIFYRRFYIFLFLLWLAATAGIFVLAVWGDLSTFLTDFDQIVQLESSPDHVEMKAVNGTMNTVEQVTEKVIHKAQVAKEAVRKEVVREVRVLEKEAEDVEKVFQVTRRAEPPTSDMSASKRQKAEAVVTQSRQHPGAGRVTGIKFTRGRSRLTTHLTTSKPVGKVTVFWLENPTRLVVDLRGDWKNEAPRINRFSDYFMYRVILGMHPDRLRVVFKFDDPKAPLGKRPGLTYTDTGLDIVVDTP